MTKAKLTRTKLDRNQWVVTNGTDSVVVDRCGPMWESTDERSKLIGFGETINEAAQQALAEMAKRREFRMRPPARAWLGAPAPAREPARTRKVKRTIVIGGDDRDSRDDEWLDAWYDSDDWRGIKW